MEVRDRFVSLHFVNKYGRDPTTSQRLRGAKIVWQNLQASAAANPSLDAATSFIIGLVTEPTTIVGRNTLQFLPGMERHETIYSNQAKLNVITRVVDQSRTSQNILSESNYQQSLRRIISETSFRQKFNLLWSASSTVDDFGFGKMKHGLVISWIIISRGSFMKILVGCTQAAHLKTIFGFIPIL